MRSQVRSLFLSAALLGVLTACQSDTNPTGPEASSATLARSASSQASTLVGTCQVTFQAIPLDFRLDPNGIPFPVAFSFPVQGSCSFGADGTADVAVVQRARVHPTNTTSVAQATFTFSDGSTLITRARGVGTPPDASGQFTIITTERIEGGSGRFANLRGTGQTLVSAQLDPSLTGGTASFTTTLNILQ